MFYYNFILYSSKIDTSEDILEKGISISIFEETVENGIYTVNIVVGRLDHFTRDNSIITSVLPNY